MDIKYISGDIYPENTTEYAVCLGVFDGIHRGHRKLVEKTLRYAEKYGIKSGVVSFQTPGENNRIYLLEQQAEILEALGIDTLFVVLLDENFKNLLPEEFIRKYLLSYMKARCVVCGVDYRFGRGRCGNADTVKEFGKKYGFDTEVAEDVLDCGERISSTAIREAVSSGNIEKANRMLGENFYIEGCVTKGFMQGRVLGYPTANIKLDSCLAEIKNGVYSTVVVIDGEVYKGLTNIGTAPTLGNNNHALSETYIVDFRKDIYNKYIKIIFKEFLREEKKFESIDELKNAIAENVRMLVNV